MDLKLRFKANSNPSEMSNQHEQNRNDPLSKYARTSKPATAKSNKSAPENNSSMNHIKKYYRSEVAPKSQYKKFFLDTNNVFYQDRESLQLRHKYHQIKEVVLKVWTAFFLVYLILIPIQPFKGQCPPNAQCGVFVHCFKGFQYDSIKNQCVVDQNLLSETEDICLSSIERLKYEWGNQDCSQLKDKTVPELRLELNTITDPQLRYQVEQKVDNFLSDSERQQELGYSYIKNTIRPTKKLYSWTCRIQMLTQTKNFRFGFPMFLLAACLLTLGFQKLQKMIKAKKIYNELRKKTEAESIVNISYAKEDIEKQYGKIDEELWEIIDSYRTKDRDIGFLQDDFLYWKKL